QLGKPDAPHFGGSPTAREGDGAAGKRGRRKRKPPCNGTDRAATAERPNPKGCRLPTGPDVGNLSDLLTLGEVRRWDLFRFIERTLGQPHGWKRFTRADRLIRARAG